MLDSSAPTLLIMQIEKGKKWEGKYFGEAILGFSLDNLFRAHDTVPGT